MSTFFHLVDLICTAHVQEEIILEKIVMLKLSVVYGRGYCADA